MKQEELTPEQHEKVNRGRRAQNLLNSLSGELAEREKTIINNLKQKFRDSKLEHIELVSNVAQLVALDDLKSSLKGQVNRANHLTKDF